MSYKMKQYEEGYFAEIDTRRTAIKQAVQADFFGNEKIAETFMVLLENSNSGVVGNLNMVIDLVCTESVNNRYIYIFYFKRDITANKAMIDDASSIRNKYNIAAMFDKTSNSWTYSKGIMEGMLQYSDINCGSIDASGGTNYYLLPLTHELAGAFEGVYVPPFYPYNGMKSYAVMEFGGDSYYFGMNFFYWSGANHSYSQGYCPFLYKIME